MIFFSCSSIRRLFRSGPKITFSIDDFGWKKKAIHTKTLEEYERLVSYIVSNNISWRSGRYDIKSHLFHVHEEKTAITLDEGTLSYCSTSWFIGADYEIINFSDLIFPEDKTVILDAEETVVEPYTEPKFGDVLECVEKYEDFHVGEKCIITDISYWYADLESEDSCGQIRKDLLENHFKLIRRL